MILNRKYSPATFDPRLQLVPTCESCETQGYTVDAAYVCSGTSEATGMPRHMKLCSRHAKADPEFAARLTVV